MSESLSKNSKCKEANFVPFTGVFAPVSTPYNLSDSLELNLSIIPQYATDLVNQGVDGIFILGTNGESVSLSLDERKKLVEAWLATPECKSKTLQVIVQIGHHCIKDTYELGAHAVGLGIQALAIVPPSFFRPQNETDTAEYLVEVAKHFPTTAIYYYHFPMMSNVRISLHKMMDLANKEAPNVVGAKYSDIDMIDLGFCCSKGYNMLMGGDALFLSGLISGASGLVGVQANYNASYPRQIYDSFQKGDMQNAMKYQEKSRELVTYIRNSSGYLAATTKEAMKLLRGLDMGSVRLPQKGFVGKGKEDFKVQVNSMLQQHSC